MSLFDALSTMAFGSSFRDAFGCESVTYTVRNAGSGTAVNAYVWNKQNDMRPDVSGGDDSAHAIEVNLLATSAPSAGLEDTITWNGRDYHVRNVTVVGDGTVTLSCDTQDDLDYLANVNDREAS